jgi:hypothetical protein
MGKKTGLSKVISDARETLKLLSPERIVELIKECDEWFGYTDNPLTTELVPRILKMGKPAQIEFILSADPIAAPGGLFDFLHDQGIIAEC